MNIINIQSITDIVTNSSTEVFIRVKETAINTVKELINDLLKIADLHFKQMIYLQLKYYMMIVQI